MELGGDFKFLEEFRDSRLDLSGLALAIRGSHFELRCGVRRNEPSALDLYISELHLSVVYDERIHSTYFNVMIPQCSVSVKIGSCLPTGGIRLAPQPLVAMLLQQPRATTSETKSSYEADCCEK